MRRCGGLSSLRGRCRGAGYPRLSPRSTPPLPPPPLHHLLLLRLLLTASSPPPRLHLASTSPPPRLHLASPSTPQAHLAARGVHVRRAPLAYCLLSTNGACKYPGELVAAVDLLPGLLEQQAPPLISPDLRQTSPSCNSCLTSGPRLPSGYRSSLSSATATSSAPSIARAARRATPRERRCRPRR